MLGIFILVQKYWSFFVAMIGINKEINGANKLDILDIKSKFRMLLLKLVMYYGMTTL